MNRFFYSAICILFASGCILHSEQEADARGPRKENKGSMSFIILGDVHYCNDSHYDLDMMLQEKPGDHRQITGTYVPVTEANWADQVSIIRKSVASAVPPVKCIVQLGDISEGLANKEGNADIMAKDVTNMLNQQNFGVPFIFAKGNHDITGVGMFKSEAKAAFNRYYVPYLKSQIGSENIHEGNYTYEVDDVLFVMLDAYNPDIDQTEFLKQSFENTTAKYKFVCMHEPAVPASERCWHYMKSKSDSEREKFLKVIAENKAFFLCGHLHRYSVLRRNTEWGPIVQVMATSVTSVKRKKKPTYELGTSDYGPGLVDWKADWSPDTASKRKAVLAEEAKYVDYYKMNNLAGYGIISIDKKKEEVTLRYYPAFENEAYDEINLTKLYNGK